MTAKNKKFEIKVDAPQLPSANATHSLEGGRFSSEGRYINLILDESDFAGQSADNVIIESAHLKGVSLSGTRFKRLKLTDVRLEKCDLSNADWSTAAFNRVEFIGCRMTGLKLIEGKVRDILWEGCKADFAQLRGTSFKDTRAEECIFREADLREAEFRGVKLSGCDLRGAEIYGARFQSTDLRGSQLEGLKFQIPDIQGITIDAEQLVTLAWDLTGLLGVIVR